ncbi:MAG: ATP synthase [Acidimicrobiia bacterium]
MSTAPLFTDPRAPLGMAARQLARLAALEPAPISGRVTRVSGLVVESAGPVASVGDVCEIQLREGRRVPAEVVGFRSGTLISVPLGDTAGICPGDRLVARGSTLTVPAGPALLGRVIDGLGHPIDGAGPIVSGRRAALRPPALNPLARAGVTEPIGTGVRVIDGLLTMGRGQRIGVFGGSGVGKSTLLGMMARGTAADVVVLALVGERGREVRAFLEEDLGAGRDRAVVVVSTSDSPPLSRIRAAFTATAIAEQFRADGANVLLMVDSITRLAMAQREIGLAAGEPPTAKGYPPSVFAMLPGLLERAGTLRGQGSISAIYTVLMDGDDITEPITDAVRGILDGHIMLSRDLASQHHFPAIDVLGSISRTMTAVVDEGHSAQAARLRGWLSALQKNEDLLSVGAYVAGSQPVLDDALARREAIKAFLCQSADTLCSLSDAQSALAQLTGQV